MIRILHIVSNINVNSGVMSFIMSYYRKIDKDYIQFDFLYWRDEEVSYRDEIEQLGGNVYKINKPNISMKCLQEINKFLKENAYKYKCVHLHEVYLNSIIGPLARKNKVKDVIAHSHTTMYSDKRLNAFRNKILCLPLKKNVNNYFACSIEAGEFLYGKKTFKNKGQVINNAIDLKRYEFNLEIRNDLRKQFKVEDKFVIGHVGRFNNQKNHDFLIDIFIEMLKMRPESVLMLIGEGPLKKDIQNKVRKLKVEDKVIFLGRRKDINNLMQVMDVLVFPSLFEGLGIVLIEAQASGLTCFASDSVPKETKVTENIKYISLKNNEIEWAQNIVLTIPRINNQINPYSIKKKGFDIEIEAEKLKKIYIEI